MAYWQTPQVNFLDPSGTISEPTSMFLASMRAGMEGRLRKRQADAQEQELAQNDAFRREQFAAQLAEQERDNARDAERIAIERQRLKQDDERERARLAREEKKQTQENTEKVYTLAQDDPAAAEFVARNRGVTFTPGQSANVQAPPSVEVKVPEQAPAAAPPPPAMPQVPFGLFGNPLAPFEAAMSAAQSKASVEPPPLSAPQAEGAPIPPPLVPPAPQAAPQAAAPAEAPKLPAAPAQQPAGFTIGGIYASATAGAEAARRKGERAAEIVKANLDRMLPLMPAELQPHAQKAALFALNEARSTGNAEEAVKRFTAQFNEFFSNEELMKRARVQAAAAAKRVEDKPPSEGQATAASRLTVMLPEAARIEALPVLSERGRQILYEELALKNAAEKSPTADALARLTGFRRSVTAQLQGTDKRVYAAYMALADPIVRQRTGANAPPGEVATVIDPILPGIDDGPADLADRRERRKDFLRSFAVQTKEPDVWMQKIDALYSGGARSAATPRSASARPAAADANSSIARARALKAKGNRP